MHTVYLNFHHHHQPVSKFQLTSQETSSSPKGAVMAMSAFLAMLAMVAMMAMMDTLHANFHSSTFMRSWVIVLQKLLHLIHSIIPPQLCYPTRAGAAGVMVLVITRRVGIDQTVYYKVLARHPRTPQNHPQPTNSTLAFFFSGLIGLWNEKWKWKWEYTDQDFGTTKNYRQEK